MKNRILAGFMSLLLAGSMMTSNVLTYAAETGKIQMEDHAYEKVGTELVREAQTVTASNADEKLESVTDEEKAKTPGDHGDYITPEQFQKVSQSLLETKLLQVETALKNAKGEFPINDVKLYRQKGKDWVELEEDETISLDDKFRVVYIFNQGESDPISVNWPEEAGEPEGIKINKGETYTLPDLSKVISKIHLTGNYEIKVIAKDEEKNNYELGIVTVKNDGTVEFLVTYEGEGVEFYDVTVSIGFTLDKNQLEKEDRLVFEIPFGTKRYDLPIQENKPVAVVKKTASDAVSENNEIEWSITIENLGVSNKGFLLTDYIHDNHKYIDDSIQCVMSPSNATCTWRMTASDADKKLEFEIDNKTPGTTLKFTYKTIVNVFGAVQYWAKEEQNIKIPVNNTAILTDQDTKEEIGRATAGKEIEKHVKPWLTKDGGVIDENGVINWTITVNNNGYDINDVVLYDHFDYAIMDLVRDSVKIDHVPADSQKIQTSLNPKEEGYCWKYGLGNMAGNKTYTITYQTQIKDFEEWKKQNYDKVTNKAWISYKYYDPYDGGTDGQPTDHTGPTVEKNAQIQPNAAIDKRASGINRVTQVVEWEVTVNKYKADMSKVIVEDHVKEGQVFYKIGEATLTASGSNATEPLDLSDKYSVCSSSNANAGREIVKIDFGNLLRGKSATFKFYTRFTDPKFVDGWAGNDGKWLYNNVYLTRDGKQEKIPAGAVQRYSSKVIQKDIEYPYNYQTHYIGYKITFNQNRMGMEDIQIDDDMSEGHLELVEDEDHPITLESQTRQEDEPIKLSNDPNQPNYYEYDKKSGKLIIHISDIKATASDAVKTKVVHYTAKVADGDAYKANNGTTTITNKAKLTTKENPAGTETTSSTTFKNNIITKEHGILDENTGCVTYTVAFNAAEQPLTKELQIVDLLGSGLLFMDDSVEMYKGIVQSDGTVLKDGNQPYHDYSYEITAEENNKSKLTVTLPNGGNAAYVLEYKVQICDTEGELTNSVSLKGYSEDKSFNSESSLIIEGTASGYVKNSVFVKVYKEDAEDHTPLAGARFAICKPDGSVIQKITSNARGIAVYSGKELVPNKKYILKEVEAPEGYKLAPKEYPFTAESGLDHAFTITIPNEKIKKGTLTIKKVLNGIGFDEGKDKITFAVKKEDGTTVQTIRLSAFSASDADHDYTTDQFESSGADNTYAYKLTELPGKYYIEETGTDQLDGYDKTKVNHAVKATDSNGERITDEKAHEGVKTELFELKENGTAEAAFENTYEKLGSLVITKTISGDVAKEEAAKTLKFKVTDQASGASSEYSLRDFTYNETTKQYELKLAKPAGGYLVEETAYELNGCRAVVTYTLNGETKTGSKTTVAVPAGGIGEVDFEDNYTSIGDLLITKTIKGDVTGTAINEVLKFRVTDHAANKSEDYTLKDFTFNKTSQRYELLLKDKKAGNYTVEETAYDLDGHTVTVAYSVDSGQLTEGSGTEAAVTRGTVTTVNFEDTYEKFGSILITKTVKGSVTKENAEDSIVFAVKDNATGKSTDYKLSDFTYDAEQKIWTKELPLAKGGYTVTETVADISGYRLASVTHKVGDGKAENGTESELNVESGKTAIVAYTDDYRKSSSGGNGGGGNSGGGSTIPTKPSETTAASQPETTQTVPETTETIPETTKEPTLEDIINRGNELAAMPDSPERDRMVSDYCDEVEEFLRKNPNALVGQPEAVRTFVLDAVNDRKVGHKRVALAKTGGFAGTVMAYGVGLLLLLGGCGLVVEKRKRDGSDK